MNIITTVTPVVKVRGCAIPIGMKLGRLTTTAHVAERINGQIRHFYTVICDCGNTYRVEGQKLASGHTISCGCYQREVSTTHGDSLLGSEYYRLRCVWTDMMQRCYNTNNKNYFRYGGRGIIVCDGWRTDRAVFKKWALANGYIKGLSLDRYPNNDGNYEPNNCRWITMKQQQRNRSDNHLITAFSETKCIAAWVEDKRCVVTSQTLCYRIKIGMDSEEAMTKPTGRAAK